MTKKRVSVGDKLEEVKKQQERMVEETPELNIPEKAATPVKARVTKVTAHQADFSDLDSTEEVSGEEEVNTVSEDNAPSEDCCDPDEFEADFERFDNWEEEEELRNCKRRKVGRVAALITTAVTGIVTLVFWLVKRKKAK